MNATELSLPIHLSEQNPLHAFGGVTSILAGLDETVRGGAPVLKRIDSPAEDPFPLSPIKLVDALTAFEPEYREALERQFIELIVAEDALVCDVIEPQKVIVSTNDDGDQLLLVWAKVRLDDGYETVRGMEFTSRNDPRHPMYGMYIRDTRTIADYLRAVDRGIARKTTLTEALHALPEASQTWFEKDIARQVLDGHPNNFVQIEDTPPGGIYTRLDPNGVKELVFQELVWEGGEDDHFVNRAVFRPTRVTGAPAYYETKPAGMPEFARFLHPEEIKTLVDEDGTTHKDFPSVHVLTSDTPGTPYVDGAQVNLLKALLAVNGEVAKTIESNLTESILALHPRLKKRSVPFHMAQNSSYNGIYVDNGEVIVQARDGDDLAQIIFSRDRYGQICLRAGHEYVEDGDEEIEGKTLLIQAFESIDPKFSVQLQTVMAFIFVQDHPMCHTPLVGHNTYSGVFVRKHTNGTSEIVIQTVGYTRTNEHNEQGPVALLRRTFSPDTPDAVVINEEIRYLRPDEY